MKTKQTKKKTERKTIAERLAELGACYRAVKWSRPYGCDKQRAWDECRRGHWLTWYAGRVSGPPESASHKKLVLCRIAIIRTALPFFEKRRPGDGRVRNCLDMTERWANGKATISELRKSQSRVKFIANADYATRAVARAAYSALAPSYANARSNAACFAAGVKDSVIADIVRSHYRKPPSLKK
jgi:hypothetical protein